MNIALINPRWDFEGSIYFGCRSPHLPLEYGYTQELLQARGHTPLIIDAQLEDLDLQEIRSELELFAPELTVLTTAPSYLFWRCAPPELRVPQQTAQAIRDLSGTLVVVGPHASTTPASTLRKLEADLVLLGECEEIILLLAETDRSRWHELSSVCYWDSGTPQVQGTPHASNMTALPALKWPIHFIRRHAHQHHRFDKEAPGLGAEMEVSRGCPYRCTFCAKDNFRSDYRKRPLSIILQELDRLLSQGVEYVYFIDEIFLPDQTLLEALVLRKVKFGVQTRIDLWKPAMLELLGRAGCVSIEAGIESITPEGRSLLDKNCRLSTGELAERLIYAKQHVPFVQANLLESPADDLESVSEWRRELADHGVWANDPVPLFPYPGSPDYTERWGMPDDQAWERAVDHYISTYAGFSDIQDARPLRLTDLENTSAYGEQQCASKKS